MEKKVIQKNLIRDCLPTVFSLMLSGLYSVMDGLFVGRAAGDTGLAAVNLAWPLVAVITATGIGIGSGGSVLFSNLAGKDEKQESEKTYHLTFTGMRFRETIPRSTFRRSSFTGSPVRFTLAASLLARASRVSLRRSL